MSARSPICSAGKEEPLGDIVMPENRNPVSIIVPEIGVEGGEETELNDDRTLSVVPLAL